jgi:hypothetical protein
MKKYEVQYSLDDNDIHMFTTDDQSQRKPGAVRAQVMFQSPALIKPGNDKQHGLAHSLRHLQLQLLLFIRGRVGNFSQIWQ